MKLLLAPKFLSHTIVIFTLMVCNFNYSQTEQIDNSVDITIDKKTTDEDLKNIISMLKEYDITAKFETVKRNSNNEITKIAIKLESANSATSSSYNFSGNAINPISFGMKNNNLYVGNDDFNFGMLNPKDRMHQFNFFSGNDSIFEHGFSGFKNFYGNMKDPFFMLGDSTDIEAIKEMLNSFDMQSFTKLIDEGVKGDKTQRYHFVDDPNTEKLIVINGEVSDFKTLNELAKSNKIETVDVLRPKSAVSIYGDKAKQGAIIITTY